MSHVNTLQTQLTEELDLIGGRDFSYDDIYKMTLWKVQRFPHIKSEALTALNQLTAIKSLEDKKDVELARNALRLLLECTGVRLPMASTYLRFRNPQVFQIIDRHVWYQLTGEDSYIYEKCKNNEEKISYYFTYLKELRAMCERDGCEFSMADRIYYDKDKKQGHKIS